MISHVNIQNNWMSYILLYCNLQKDLINCLYHQNGFLMQTLYYYNKNEKVSEDCWADEYALHFHNVIKEYSQKLAIKQKKHYRIAENKMVRVWLKMVMYSVKF